VLITEVMASRARAHSTTRWGLAPLAMAACVAGCSTNGPVSRTLLGSPPRITPTTRPTAAPAPPVRPTAAQRREIVASLDSQWVPGFLGELQELEQQYWAKVRQHVDYTRLHPEVTGIRISSSKPRLASAAVELVDHRERRVLATTIIVLSEETGPLRQELGPWSISLGPTTSFPGACGLPIEASLRELLCPNPWVVLGYRPPPGIPSGLGFTTPAGTTNIDSVDWGDVSTPGSACGADEPIHMHNGLAYVESAVEPWWPVVVASIGSQATYGDLAGRQVAIAFIECTNGGGTADGQMGFAAVVYTLKDGLLSVIGVLTPRQPLNPNMPHVPLLGRLTIEKDEVIAEEAWYGPNDGTCCASGEAMTLWRLSHGFLAPYRTIVVRKPNG